MLNHVTVDWQEIQRRLDKARATLESIEATTDDPETRAQARQCLQEIKD